MHQWIGAATYIGFSYCAEFMLQTTKKAKRCLSLAVENVSNPSLTSNQKRKFAIREKNVSILEKARQLIKHIVKVILS